MVRTTRNLYLSPTLAQIVPGHCVMPDFGRLLPFWAILIFGQGTLLRVRLTIHFLFLNPCPNGGVTLFVLPDMGSFSHLWAFVLFGQGIFHGESSNPFIARGGRLSYYSPCAEGTSICWLSKFERQFHLIIPNGSTRLSCSSAKPICGITKYSPSFKINFDLVSN